jgi:crossover junction endodeoxyribonuclease RuvC
MIILGIDPGSRMTGWGLVDYSNSRSTYLASGTIRLGSGAPLPQRLVKLTESLEELLERYNPGDCAIEQIFTAKNARSALVLGHARGVILCAVARKGVNLQEYSATQVKQAVVGQGRAEKSQMQLMVGALLGRKEALQEDEADALAVALTHAAFSNLARRIS